MTSPWIKADLGQYAYLTLVQKRKHIRFVTGESATVVICKRTNKIIAAFSGFDRFVKGGRL
jgi:hypothetical protein